MTCSHLRCARPPFADGELCGLHLLRSRRAERTVDEPQPARPLRDVDELAWPYMAAHRRVWRERGRATDHACARCVERADEWAYDHADPDVQYGDNGHGKRAPYSLDVQHYLPLCCSCHRQLDADERPAKPRELCSIDECDAVRRARGLCTKHYFRARRQLAPC